MEFIRTYPRRHFSSNDLTLIWQIRGLMLRGGDPNQRGYGGSTLLHKATRLFRNHFGAVKLLINAGADVNLTDHLDITPLQLAVLNQNCSIVEELINSGALVNAMDFLGNTILHLAVGYWEINRYHWTVIPDAWIIDKLLKYEDIDCNLSDSNGNTPLMIAVKSGQTMVAQKLIKCKHANPNLSNKTYETPLHIAFSLPVAFPDLWRSLLLNGASIYALDKNGQTPLDILLENGSLNRMDNFENGIKTVLKVIAFQYSIKNDILKIFLHFPEFLMFLKECCCEIDRMRNDFVSGNVTFHDFVMNCFNDNQFDSVLMQIHKPVVDRLVRDVYPEYFTDIIRMVPYSSLNEILGMTVCSNNRPRGNVANDLAYLLSIRDILVLITEYLSYYELFLLIVAFSDVIIAESMVNLKDRSESALIWF